MSGRWRLPHHLLPPEHPWAPRAAAGAARVVAVRGHEPLGGALGLFVGGVGRSLIRWVRIQSCNRHLVSAGCGGSVSRWAAGRLQPAPSQWRSWSAVHACEGSRPAKPIGCSGCRRRRCDRSRPSLCVSLASPLTLAIHTAHAGVGSAAAQQSGLYTIKLAEGREDCAPAFNGALLMPPAPACRICGSRGFLQLGRSAAHSPCPRPCCRLPDCLPLWRRSLARPLCHNARLAAPVAPQP